MYKHGWGAVLICSLAFRLRLVALDKIVLRKASHVSYTNVMRITWGFNVHETNSYNFHIH